VTLNSALLGYAGLYALGSVFSSPGYCRSEWNNDEPCIPYNIPLEESKSSLVKKYVWLQSNYKDDRKGFYNGTYFLSTELFYRYISNNIQNVCPMLV
jgi:hypothetical protein